jgi:hypothetical protein
MAGKVKEPRKNPRDARAKKLLLVLVPVLVALVAWQGPKVLNQVRGEEPAEATSEQPTESSSGTNVPSEGADTEAAPAETTPTDEVAADAAAIAVANAQVLPNTDVPPMPDEGQLIVFSRFEARDPFVQLVDDQEVASDDPSADTSSSGSTTTTNPPPSSSSVGTPGGSTSVIPPDGGSSTATEAKISVNGRMDVLVVGDTFPENDPAFTVVSISSDSVEIGLASGSFATGQDTITLKLGEPVTLISQPDGARFTLKLISTS